MRLTSSAFLWRNDCILFYAICNWSLGINLENSKGKEHKETKMTSSYSSSVSSPSSVSPGHPCHAPPPLPAGWQECVSKSTGRTYFWNQQTKKSQWDRPTKPAIIPQQLSPVEVIEGGGFNSFVGHLVGGNRGNLEVVTMASRASGLVASGRQVCISRFLLFLMTRTDKDFLCSFSCEKK